MRDLTLTELTALGTRFLFGNRFLGQAPNWSRDRMLAWQFDQIRRLVTFAFESIPFYRELYAGVGFTPKDLASWDDFRRLPVVTKDQVIANYPARMLKAGADLNSLIVSRSSGSSGKVLDIAYDSRAMVTFIQAGLRLYRMGVNYKPWHRQVYIYTSPYPMNSLFGLYPMRFVSTLAPMDEILAALRRYRPHLLVCYPSHLKQIAQSFSLEDFRLIRPRVISVNSEMSAQAERDEMAALFRCPVLDEYSSEELTRIAAQCLHKNHHIFEDINFIETLDESGRPTSGQGLIVGTNLHNTAMPMIRYQQNDLGSIVESECPCGWRFRKLVNLQGRRNDSFVMPSGRILSSGFLLDATYEFLLAYRTAVRDFCLIQDAPAAVRLQVVPGRGWTEDVARAIASRFQGFLEPPVAFRIELAEVCEKTRTGKRNPIICRANTSGG
jgi:phenylacetate-CoA ligase